MSKSIYRVGIVGCGRIASTFDDDAKRKNISTHIGAYKHLQNTDIVAACDINKKRLKKCVKKWNIPQGYTDIGEMLKKEKIDIISICTPPETHYTILKEAVKFPLRAIFCEKPLASNLKDGRNMVKLCKKKGVTLQVDYQRRFDPLHIKIKEIIKNRRLGDTQQVNFYYTAGIKNTGSHMFDILCFFFGNVKWIEAIFSKNKSGNEKDPNVDGILKFRNGLFATFQACDVKKYLVFEMNCFSNKGRFILKHSGWALDFYGVKESPYYSGYKELHKAKNPFSVSYKRNFMVNAVRHLVACIKGKKQSVSSGEAGCKSLELIEATLTSAKNNGKRIFLSRKKNE